MLDLNRCSILLEGWYRGITIVGKSTLCSGSTAVQWAVLVIRALPTGRDAYDKDKIGQYLLDASRSRSSQLLGTSILAYFHEGFWRWLLAKASFR